MSASNAAPSSALGVSGTFKWAGYALGFAIGGFFDGILLHQVLQWHHLLSGLEGGRFDDLRFQILADGLFHMLMYVIGGVGLWLLWRSRREFGLPGADRLLFAKALIGFGAWHVLDGIVSHWILGIHRIRMASDAPLVWDLIWLVAFGIIPIIVGWLIGPHDTDIPKRPAATPTVLAVVAILGGAGATVPPADLDGAPMVVVFGPGITPSDALAAIASVDGHLIWSDSSDQVWAIDVPKGASRAPLYASGAWLVSGSILPLGCLDWIRG